jgi:hypothetical protein
MTFAGKLLAEKALIAGFKAAKTPEVFYVQPSFCGKRDLRQLASIPQGFGCRQVGLDGRKLLAGCNQRLKLVDGAGFVIG